MKKFKVNFTMKSGRRTHRYFLAPSLSEAQEQFASVTKIEVKDCEWFDCPYLDITYKDADTNDVFSLDALYVEYLAKHPTKDVTFMGFLETH
jgi:hypothetical protein